MIIDKVAEYVKAKEPRKEHDIWKRLYELAYGVA